MEVLGEDQRAALAEALRAGVPKTPHYAGADFGAAFKQGQSLGQGLAKGMDKLSEAGDGSIYEGLKNKLGVGNPNIYADNYEAEFGQYDPAFNAGSTMPAGTQTGGMYGNGAPNPYALSGVNLDGSLYRGNGR
jgi:hypothetical protein